MAETAAWKAKRLGIGMCVRNEGGRFVLEKTMCFSPVCSVDVGEALGLYYAIRWVHELQLQNVDFEVDSKRVADYFNRSKGDITEFGIMMDSNIQHCSFNLANSHVEFIRRQANEVAHELPKGSHFLDLD
jgi:ribonuclease HI